MVWGVDGPTVGDRHIPAARLQCGCNPATAWAPRLLPRRKRTASARRDSRGMSPSLKPYVSAARRPDVPAGHAYTVPVVRELPRPVPDAVGDRSW
jgi:hypothetical protein